MHVVNGIWKLIPARIGRDRDTFDLVSYSPLGAVADAEASAENGPIRQLVGGAS